MPDLNWADYPATDGKTFSVNDRDEAKRFMAGHTEKAEADLVVGVDIGREAPRGVGKPEDFVGYTPIHMINDPADGINDGKKFVTYFEKDDTDPKEVYKATDADPSTLVKLTTGDEYDLAWSHRLNANG
jgi:hypothetical protein